MASVSASPSASQEPPTTGLETPSESNSRSASGVIEPPRARPTHTPKTPGDGTDEEEHQQEAVVVVDDNENELDRIPLDTITPEEQLMTGDPNHDINLLIYHMRPEIVPAQEHVDPVIRQLVDTLNTKKSTEEEDEYMRNFLPTCFDSTYDDLMEQEIPVDEDIQLSLGVAADSFPELLPRVFRMYRSAAKRMIARHAEQRRQEEEEEEEEEAPEETHSGNNVPEFTQHLMRLLEESTPSEHWDADLRMTLTNQLIEILEQSTSTDPNYLVTQYEGHLQSLTSAQNKRLRVKYGANRADMLKESGVIRRIIAQIPDVARKTFETHQYNPDKRGPKDPVYAEAEYEVNTGDLEAETQQSSASKRPGSTIAPPEAKMAARPDSMASYRNPKQEVIPSEAQMPGHSERHEELEDDQLQKALKMSAQEVQRDPTETPNTGGSAASSSPSGIVGVQSRKSPGTPTSKTTEELAIAQANFRRVSQELFDLQDKIRGVNCADEDLDQMVTLQTQLCIQETDRYPRAITGIELRRNTTQGRHCQT